MTAYQIVSSTRTFVIPSEAMPVGGPQGFVLNCPTGKKVVAGGATVTGSSSPGEPPYGGTTWLVASTPIASGDGWLAQFGWRLSAPTTSDPEVEFQITIACAQVG
jgi:hypothetical protein